MWLSHRPRGSRCLKKQRNQSRKSDSDAHLPAQLSHSAAAPRHKRGLERSTAGWHVVTAASAVLRVPRDIRRCRRPSLSRDMTFTAAVFLLLRPLAAAQSALRHIKEPPLCQLLCLQTQSWFFFFLLFRFYPNKAKIMERFYCLAHVQAATMSKKKSAINAQKWRKLFKKRSLNWTVHI